MQAIEQFGILRGLVLAGWRVLRCNPWSHGGFDPVEDQRLFSPRSAEPRAPDHASSLANIFQPLIDVFEAVLMFFHDSVGVSWGWSIVALTVVVRAVLLPLTLRQFKSMQRLQRLAPEIKALQAKYKDDKQRQQQEMMKLYKENQVNPFGVLPPARAPAAGLHLAVLHAARRACGSTSARRSSYALSGSACTTVAGTATRRRAGRTTARASSFIPDLTTKATGAVLIMLILLYVGTQLGSTLLMSIADVDRTSG